VIIAEVKLIHFRLYDIIGSVGAIDLVADGAFLFAMGRKSKSL